MDTPPSLPSASDEDELLFDSQYECAVIDQILSAQHEPLEKERQALLDGNHPEFLDEVSRAHCNFESRMEQIGMIEQEEKERINREYEEDLRSLKQEYEKKLNEFAETLYHEQEEQKRMLENEINMIDIAHLPTPGGGVESASLHHHQPHQGASSLNIGSSHHSNSANAQTAKKFLRRRPNDAPCSSNSISGVEASNTFAASNVLMESVGTGTKRRNQSKKGESPFIFAGHGISGSAALGVIGASSSSSGVPTGQMVPYLLSESAIAEDIHRISNEMGHSHGTEGSSAGRVTLEGLGVVAGNEAGHGTTTTAGPSGVDMEEEMTVHRFHRRVVLEQNKIILDGKTFQRGQNVYIDTKSGRIPAIIRSISEGRYVEFRSGIKGDTRQITASKDDLENGRVFVKKRYLTHHKEQLK